LAHKAETPPIYDFESFRLYASRDILTRDGKRIPLRGIRMKVLVVLVENGGRTVSRDDFTKNVWGGRIVSENNLDQHIGELRKILGEGPGDNKYIETVRGEGYKFVAAVKIVGTADDDAREHRIRNVLLTAIFGMGPYNSISSILGQVFPNLPQSYTDPVRFWTNRIFRHN
jgi:DNA-binding winged helix-turn-helix (wHTH) protein